MIQLTLHNIFLLLICFQVKHFLADYPFQTQFMLKKFSSNPREWLPALSSHAAIHGILTAIIVLLVVPSLWWLCLVDFGIHFTVDLLKASKSIGSRWPSTSKYFWWCLGFDQMLHHLTHYFIIWFLLK